MIAPKESGISAATGERKTSSRTSSRTGRAISSLRSEAAIDSSWIARERVAKPVCVAVDRRRHLFFEDLVEFVDRVADRVVDADVEVGEDQRLVRRRPQVADFALVPGGDGRHLRVGRAQRVDELRALFLDLLGGPWSRIANGAESPKYWRSILLAWLRVGARDVERGRVELALDVAADPAEDDDQDQRDDQRRARPPQRQRPPSLTGA